MRDGAILTIAVLVLVVVSVISGYMMWISFNQAQTLAKQFMDEHERRYSKLISRSLIYSVIRKASSYQFTDYPPSVKDDFVNYLRKNKFMGYGWVDTVENATDLKATTINFSGEPWDNWEVLLMRFRIGTNKVMYVAKAEKKNKKFTETFTWAYGKIKGPTLSATEVHENAVYSPEDVNLGGSFIWTNNLDVYGPIMTSKKLSVGSQHPRFHDTVVASSIETTEWFGRAVFDKDVYTKSLYLNAGGANLKFNSNLYAENIQGDGWYSRISVKGNVCASSVKLSNSDGIEIGGNLSANDIDIEDTDHISVGGSMRSNNLKISHIWNGVYVRDDITSCNMDFSGRYTSEVQARTLNASNLYMDNVDNLILDSLNVGNATLTNSSGKIDVNDIRSISLKLDSNGKFYSNDYMCVNKDLLMTDNNQIELNRFTVLGNLTVDNSSYKVSDESSVVGRYEISNLWSINVDGDTYVGKLTGEQSCWGRNGFKKKVYSPETPDISSRCLKAGWQRIDRSLLESIRPCQVNVSCPVGTCFEEAEDKLEQLDHLKDPFPDSQEYFSSLSEVVEDTSELCSVGSENPVGIHFSSDVELEIIGDTLMELHFNSGNIVVKYVVSGDECPPYNATIYCGNSMKNFKFNGVVFTDGSMTVGKAVTWPPQRTKTVYGRLFLIARNDISIYSPFVYDFLPRSTSRWPSAIEEAYEEWKNTGSGNSSYIEVLAGGNVDLAWQNWWFGGNNRISAEFISLDGKVVDKSLSFWRNKLTLLGGVYAKKGVEMDPQNLTLISDKRLTLPNFYTCNGQVSDVRYEPFSTNQNGSGGGESFDLEVVR